MTKSSPHIAVELDREGMRLMRQIWDCLYPKETGRGATLRHLAANPRIPMANIDIIDPTIFVMVAFGWVTLDTGEDGAWRFYRYDEAAEKMERAEDMLSIAPKGGKGVFKVVA